MTKRAIEMTAAERESALAEIKRKARTFEPLDMTKKAADMSAQERAEWLAEHKRRTT